MKTHDMNRILIFLLTVSFHFLANAQTIRPEQIEIIRDSFGVPHIYAPTDAQVAYGLAWAHAEDDFQTIQLTLLGAKQMLGRHLGKKGAPVDYVVGLLDCEGVVNQHKASISQNFLDVMQGYVEGINAFAAAYPHKVWVKKSFPVSVDDMLKAYVLSLSVMLGADETIQSLFENRLPNLWSETKGSNGFAFSRNKTTDGNVYLAVNSHQPLEGPVSWYEAHLISDEGWNVLGGLFPGGTTIFHGTNPYLGWAHMVNYPDKIDIWQLEMKEGKKNTYLVDGNKYQLSETKVKLKIKMLGGLTLNVKKKAFRSLYGPVIKNDSGVYAFDVAALHDLRVPEQWYRMNKATDFNSFKKALDMMSLPMFNIIYADKEDQIYYVSNAKLPKRNPDYNWQQVVPGNTSKTQYSGYYSFDELPQILNPTSGYLYNTNHSPFYATSQTDNLNPDDFDPTMGYRVWNNNRSLRFQELISQYDSIGYEDFLNIKYDLKLPDSLAFFLDLNSLFTMPVDQYPQVAELLSTIQQWDRVASVERVGVAQFIELYKQLQKQTGIQPPTIYRPTTEEIIEALLVTQSYFINHFDKINVTLGEYQQLVRGDKTIPIKGMPDVIAAMYSSPYEQGKMKAVAGESYIMLVRYPTEGLPIIETINVYGASNQTGSRHYSDQMAMFAAGKRKKMTLDLEEVRKSAVRIYHPQ